MNSLKQFFLLSFCAAFCLAAQAQEPDTGQQSGWKTSAGWEFAPVGAKWCYFDQYRTPRHNEGFLLMECVKDTVISNLPMREIARKYVDIYRDGADPTVSQMESFFVHCREDSVYIHNPETGGLDLLYVFNAQPGDTLGLTVPYYADYATPGWAFSIRIDDVTTKDMGGVPVKAYSNSICEAETGFSSTFYDYVGSVSMFFPVSVLPGTGTHFLASYYDPVVGRLQFADVKSVMKYFPWDVYPWDIEDCLMGTDAYPWDAEETGWKTSAGWEFAPVGAKWCYFERPMWYMDEGFDVMECVKDTVLNGLYMRKIDRKFVEMYRDGAEPTVTSRESFFVHCKEDSVYIYNPKTQGLDRLYIFNAQKGDTLALDLPYYGQFGDSQSDTFHLYIDSISVKDMGGVPVKSYIYSVGYDEAGYGGCVFYDYAGGAVEFFPQYVWTPEYEHVLLSYCDPVVGRLQFTEKEGNIYYPWDVYPWDIEDWLMGEDDNYPWGVGEVSGQPGAEVRVAYSPEERRLTVERPVQGADGCRTVLFTDRGVQALEFAGTEADLSSLPAGIYLVQVRDGKGGAVLHTGKIQVR